MKWLVYLSLMLSSTVGFAELIKKDVTYKVGKTEMQGYLVYEDSISDKAPGVLVVHDWMGLTDKTKKQANEYAKLGYVAFAADVYGKGVRPTNQEEAAKLSSGFKKDRKKFREHLNAALKQLRKQKQTNTKIAAVGYCFGGTGVIELARSGAKIEGVVSVHGGLDSPEPKDGKNIRTRVLALHGADDPYVPADELKAFEDEMRTHNVDWQLVKYGNAVHSFTDETLGTDNSKGAAYNKKADERSWIDIQNFFKQIF